MRRLGQSWHDLGLGFGLETFVRSFCGDWYRLSKLTGFIVGARPLAVGRTDLWPVGGHGRHSCRGIGTDFVRQGARAVARGEDLLCRETK